MADLKPPFGGHAIPPIGPTGDPLGQLVTDDRVDTARYLTLHHGPGFEDFVAAAAGADEGISDPDRLTAIAADHGIDIVGPPSGSGRRSAGSPP